MSGLPVHALVLAAGLGTRARPLTRVRAKAAFPVAGEPLIRRIAAWLAAAGVRHLVVNLHHRPESITRLLGDGSDFDLEVRYSWEPVVLGTAGGPRHALPLLGDRFLIVNGDTLTDVDLARLAAAHEGSGARVTMALVPNADPARYGGVLVEEHGSVGRFLPPGAPRSSFHYVGVQVVEAGVFADLPDGRPAQTVNQIYPSLLARAPGAIRAFISDATFHDIGTPADYLATSLALARAEGLGDRLPAGRGSVIDPAARLIRTIVWDEAAIERGCELTDCIVTDGVRVRAGSRFARRVLRSAGATAPAGDEVVIGGLLVAPLDLPRPTREGAASV